jgi:UDP-N-acetylglucosamine 2-epimerase (non-hydrolysing)
MKVVTVVGTRPELIRLSRVISRLDTDFDHVLVHTGQNRDPQLREVFFRELAIRRPDHWLEVPTSSLGATLGALLASIESVLVAERPDAMLVLGDTNSCFSAIIAKRMGIPVFHMEAGNRCYDENVPEETNRRIIDHTADFNLCYTEHARRNLLAEGLPARRIFVTGSPMGEVVKHHRDQIAASDVLERLTLSGDDYYVVSIHRQENVDNAGRLQSLTSAIGALGRETGCRLVVTAHPRLRDRLRGAAGVGDFELYEPFGFLDYIKLQQHSRCVLSDSGTLSEEAAIVGFPGVTIRTSMERPEALEAGAVLLGGVEERTVRACVEQAVRDWRAGGRSPMPAGYEVTDCSYRVSRLVRGLTGVHDEWLGLRGVE